MTQLILVLEENPEIQLVIAVSLKESDITIRQESDPDLFVQQVSKLKPDLIFLSNSDSEQDYKTCREIRAESDLKNTPIILLANAKDEVDEHLLSELKINGLLRKPFEASMLQEQLSPFITLDENFGSEPDEDDEEFLIDMSTIDNQLKEIKQGKKISAASAEEEALQLDGFEQSVSGLGLNSSPGSHMDSIILDNHQLIQEQTDGAFQQQESMQDANEMRVEVLEESADAEMDAVVEEIPEDELEMDDGFEFDLKLDEDELETNSVETESATVPVEPEPVTNGLEQLKHSGLEDQFAESRLTESSVVDQDAEAEISPVDQVEEPEQHLRAGLTAIDLAVNDFEDPGEIWSNPPDLEQTLREGLTDISLQQTDFQPEYPKNLSSFETPAETRSQDMEISEDLTENLSELDDYELQQSTDENELEAESSFDNMLLSDSVDEEFEEDSEVEDVEQFVFETSADEFEEALDLNADDVEISSMVEDSLNDQEDNEESALGELEELNEQMEALESDETEFEAEEEAFEDALQKEEIETAAIAAEGFVAEGITEAEVDSEEFLADIMVEELGDLLEDDDVLEAEDGAEDGIVEELEDSVIDRLDDMVVDDVEFETETYSETSPHVQEEVFDSWDEAEDAFMDFDRETVFNEKDSTLPEIDGVVFDNLLDDDENFESSETYRFTEKELKEIVTGSVQKALEKSIASSLVELAVSELKSQVAQMDQS
ncbi:MAG: response regulator [Deltaproteobacteria bacterium]|nr:response regulator [Deltaproteobacteria bacterium]